MNRKLKVLQIGCGFTGSYILKNLLHHGAEVVGVVDSAETKIGKDAGEVIGINPIGVNITDLKEIDSLLETTTPDIAVIATVATLDGIYDLAVKCLSHKCNVITTSEEADYPWNHKKEMAEKLDEIAKANNVTISASGVPDLTWVTVSTLLAGGLNKLTKITGAVAANLEGYYKDVALEYDAMKTMEEFEQKYASINNLTAEEQTHMVNTGEYTPAQVWRVNGAICERLGLNVISQKATTEPMLCETEFESSTFERTIKKGEIVGRAAVATTETKEGVTIQTKFITKLFGPTESTSNVWEITGEPNINFTVKSSDEFALTAASIVNRIPTVVNAPAGYVSSEKLDNPCYLTNSIETYIK